MPWQVSGRGSPGRLVSLSRHPIYHPRAKRKAAAGRASTRAYYIGQGGAISRHHRPQFMVLAIPKKCCQISLKKNRKKNPKVPLIESWTDSKMESQSEHWQYDLHLIPTEYISAMGSRIDSHQYSSTQYLFTSGYFLFFVDLTTPSFCHTGLTCEH